MKSAVRVVAGIPLTIALLASRLPGQAPQGTPEELREYEVVVKQKTMGKVSIRTHETQDGATVSITDTNVEAEYLLMKHRYEYHGQETWRGDRLVRLDSRTNDNGKQLAVSAAVDSDRSAVNIKGKQPQAGPAFVMTSNFWRLPDLRLAKGKFSIIDSDTGTSFSVQLTDVGPETVVLGNQKVASEHYRISGDTAAELWFDRQGRLLRQQTVEQGFQTELRLARVSTVSAAQDIVKSRPSR